MEISTSTFNVRGVSKKTIPSWKTQTLGTSYSETIDLLDLKLRQQGVLMSTPCCRSLRSNRSIVSEYEVPKVWVFQEGIVFFETPRTLKVEVEISKKCLHNYFVSVNKCVKATGLSKVMEDIE